MQVPLHVCLFSILFGSLLSTFLLLRPPPVFSPVFVASCIKELYKISTENSTTTYRGPRPITEILPHACITSVKSAFPPPVMRYLSSFGEMLEKLAEHLARGLKVYKIGSLAFQVKIRRIIVMAFLFRKPQKILLTMQILF